MLHPPTPVLSRQHEHDDDDDDDDVVTVETKLQSRPDSLGGSCPVALKRQSADVEGGVCLPPAPPHMPGGLQNTHTQTHKHTVSSSVKQVAFVEKERRTFSSLRFCRWKSRGLGDTHTHTHTSLPECLWFVDCSVCVCACLFVCVWIMSTDDKHWLCLTFAPPKKKYSEYTHWQKHTHTHTHVRNVAMTTKLLPRPGCLWAEPQSTGGRLSVGDDRKTKIRVHFTKRV